MVTGHFVNLFFHETRRRAAHRGCMLNIGIRSSTNGHGDAITLYGMQITGMYSERSLRLLRFNPVRFAARWPMHPGCLLSFARFGMLRSRIFWKVGRRGAPPRPLGVLLSESSTASAKRLSRPERFRRLRVGTMLGRSAFASPVAKKSGERTPGSF